MFRKLEDTVQNTNEMITQNQTQWDENFAICIIHNKDI